MIASRACRLSATLLATCLVTTGLAGCATQADIQDLALEQRKIRGQLADTRASLESMQRELARLRGGVDEARYSSRERKSFETRLAEIEARTVQGDPRTSPTPGAYGGSVSLPSGEASPLVAPTPRPAEPVASTCLGAGEDAPEEYRRGVGMVREGSYDRAIKAFREFLRTSKDTPYLASAHYGIGESYYMLGDYYQAILNFNDVRQEYGKSACAPAAVLKIGLAFLQMGNKSEARVAFQKVVNDYPSSPEAQQAREKLRSL